MNVCPFSNSYCTQVNYSFLHKTSITILCLQTNTFQLVIASLGTTSYAIFTYKCNLLEWSRHNAVIGYSAGCEYFENHPLSRTSKVTDIDCLNYP